MIIRIICSCVYIMDFFYTQIYDLIFICYHNSPLTLQTSHDDFASRERRAKNMQSIEWEEKWWWCYVINFTMLPYNVGIFMITKRKNAWHYVEFSSLFVHSRKLENLVQSQFREIWNFDLMANQECKDELTFFVSLII